MGCNDDGRVERGAGRSRPAPALAGGDALRGGTLLASLLQRIGRAMEKAVRRSAAADRPQGLARGDAASALVALAVLFCAFAAKAGEVVDGAHEAASGMTVVSDEALERISGRGAEEATIGAPSTPAVILWDERRVHQGGRPPAAQALSIGQGNAQSMSLWLNGARQ